MLVVDHLSFDYQEQPLLQALNFRVSAGELMHLKGGNGAGKTTLLKLVAGLYQPLSGQIRFEEINIQNDLSAYQSKLCYIGHHSALNPSLTLRENCLFDLYYQGQDLDELFHGFGLNHQSNVLTGFLSAGQKRQAALLRLWMSGAKMWLLDEPLVALDAQALATLMQKIVQHRDKGGLILMTSHQNLPLDRDDYKEYCL